MMQCTVGPTSSISFLCCAYCTGCHSSCQGSKSETTELPGVSDCGARR
uniref:Uncharacterized protein n=1 Tax=Arundo donax TaxID=35708 RepID=A0A0A9ASE3_ARUDO